MDSQRQIGTTLL